MTVVIFENLTIEVIDLTSEYNGALPYTGDIKYAIVSDNKSEEELAAIEELKPYCPFVVITSEMFEVMKDSKRNDSREHKRDYLYHDVYAIDDERVPTDVLSDPAVKAESSDTYNHIIDEMMKLPGRQGERLYLHKVVGLSVEEIALLDGVTTASVYESLSRAKKAIHKVFVESGVTEE